ncbi:hypothetical protein D8I24_4069 (plasmid) [Cupriavidus necator H850]|nr:hypothetical protein D8I24_4069 [Cupriavidus necator H850]
MMDSFLDTLGLKEGVKTISICGDLYADEIGLSFDYQT